MRYAVISDVHSNLEALTAVLKKIDDEKVETILFLGDIVGYGPNPNECIEVIQKIVKVSLMGNHDSAVISLTDLEYFNPNARTAIEWTKEVLSDKSRAFLEKLPLTESLKQDSIYLVHATPKEPEQWHYILNTQDAYINFHYFTERICFIGHSHQPFIAEQNPKGLITVYEDYANLKEGCRYIINVGSIGQPRDGNPDAAYVLLVEDSFRDKNSVEIKRVSYDIVSTQKKMQEAGLPLFLINRLAKGR